MFRVRLASVEDHLIIANFQKQMAKESEELVLDEHTLNNGVLSVFRNPQKGKYFVAELNGKVIASMMITYEWSDWRNQQIYWLQSVYVIPEYRQKGVFKVMYNHIKELVLRDNEVAGIRLYVDKSNNNAINVYRALGMDDSHYSTFEWMKDF